MDRTKNSVKAMYERLESQQSQTLQSQIDDIQKKLYQIELSERKQELGKILDKEQLDEIEEKDELQRQLFRLKNELQKSQRAQSQSQWQWNESNQLSIPSLPYVPKNYICKNCNAKGIHWIMRCDKIPQFIPIKVYQDVIVDFRHIQESGLPYNCPFCNFVFFDAWYQWKRHWYKYHNTQYFQVHQSNLDRKQMGMYTIMCRIYCFRFFSVLYFCQ